MFRYKSKEQAIVIAALVILLCLACLTGATFALFTNDPNEGTIGVVATAGRIEVDIVDTAGVSLKGSTLQFQTTANRPAIYFEPGARILTQPFVVENNGSIPIKFRISISENESITTSDFYDAFEVWIVTDPMDPDSAQMDKKFVGELDPYTHSGEYYLMVKMKESAGNGFQGNKYSGIGITVYAVQGNVDIEE